MFNRKFNFSKCDSHFHFHVLTKRFFGQSLSGATLFLNMKISIPWPISHSSLPGAASYTRYRMARLGLSQLPNVNHLNPNSVRLSTMLPQSQYPISIPSCREVHGTFSQLSFQPLSISKSAPLFDRLGQKIWKPSGIKRWRVSQVLPLFWDEHKKELLKNE